MISTWVVAKSGLTLLSFYYRKRKRKLNCRYMTKKRRKIRIKLYVWHGSTVYNVTGNRDIKRMFFTAINEIVKAENSDTLPYELYLEQGDMNTIYDQIFAGKRRNGSDIRDIDVSFDGYYDGVAGKPVLRLMEISRAPSPKEVSEPDEVNDNKK